MNKDELQTKIKNIEVEYITKKDKVYTTYALSNNPYKIGQIIEDHYQRILIEEIKIRMSKYDESECVYYGPLLTKKNKPFKSHKKNLMYQSNVKRVIELSKEIK